jgi:hypothetical protein
MNIKTEMFLWGLIKSVVVAGIALSLIQKNTILLLLCMTVYALQNINCSQTHGLVHKGKQNEM